jgi:DNA-binding CsgD family transcriptional regulator
MSVSDAVERGRSAFARHAWSDAYHHLSVADRERSLEIDDLERLAIAAYLLSREDESAEVWERAHRVCLQSGNAAHAARCAFWLAFGLLNRGEVARASGWLSRAGRLIEERQLDCVEQGYLLVPAGLAQFVKGDLTAAYEVLDRAVQVGARFGDHNLVSLARTAQGRTLVRMGQISQGMTMLDEVMVAVTTDVVSPMVVGVSYCNVIDACLEIFDLSRAQQWTRALSDWCASQPDLVPYRGECLVFRTEIMQLHGSWSDAAEEAQRACEWLSRPVGPVTGAAFYQRAELHRLRGEFSRAERAYRKANRFGYIPQPGLALLRLAQQQIDAAAAISHQLAEEVQDRRNRAKVLAAHTDIMLAVGDTSTARAAADELTAIATALDAPFLLAASSLATGAVLLAEGNARQAIDVLRNSWLIWQELEAPYDAARVRVLIGLAYRAIGNEDIAMMELDAAGWVFRQLGAMPDIARVDRLLRTTEPKAAGGLTVREVEVLQLVAAGKTNRAIADELFLSERTIDRHVSNIFNKLGVSSRAAASAFAVEHGLV